MTLGASYGTVGDIEVAFTLIAACGLVFSLWNLSDALADLRALHESGSRNGRFPIAKVGVRVEAARVVIQAIFVVLGAFAMTLPEAMDEFDRPWNIVAIGILFRWGLILAAALILFQSVENQRLRQYLRTYPTSLPDRREPGERREHGS